MKKLFVFAVFFSLFLGLARAADINVNLPNVPSAQSNPGAFVGGLYQFSLGIAGLLAFGMIVYAGLRYTFAAGNPSTQSDARDQILQALLGILLLLGAFIVLTTINPNLVNLTLPGLTPIQGQQSGGGGTTTFGCNSVGQCVLGGGGKSCTTGSDCTAGGGSTGGTVSPYSCISGGVNFGTFPSKADCEKSCDVSQNCTPYSKGTSGSF